MLKKSLVLLFFSGLGIVILSILYTPASCVRPTHFENLWYEFGFFIGLVIMFSSLGTYLIIPKKEELENV